MFAPGPGASGGLGVMGHDPWCIAMPSPGCSLRCSLWVWPASRRRADDGYRAEIEQFRKRREAGLKAEDGWLSVVGLHWLRQGESKLGSDPASDVLLPVPSPGGRGDDRPERRPRDLPASRRG